MSAYGIICHERTNRFSLLFILFERWQDIWNPVRPFKSYRGESGKDGSNVYKYASIVKSAICSELKKMHNFVKLWSEMPRSGFNSRACETSFIICTVPTESAACANMTYDFYYRQIFGKTGTYCLLWLILLISYFNEKHALMSQCWKIWRYHLPNKRQPLWPVVIIIYVPTYEIFFWII